MWVDTHCHPYFKHFDADREAIIRASFDSGVKKMIVIGCDIETNRKSLELAGKYDFIFATLGIHPTECDDLTDEEIDFIRANSGKIVGIGEMGMDYHHNTFSKEIQEETFRKQIRLANEFDLPCIVHSRDAKEDTLRILLDEKAKKVVFHCYSYDYEFAKKVWNEGYFTSFSGVVTYDNAKDIQEAAQKGPLDLFLLETDCPFLPPASIRGKRNDMTYVKEVGEKIASLRKMKPEVIAITTTKNAENLFKI